jgi:hypothetical protein
MITTMIRDGRAVNNPVKMLSSFMSGVTVSVPVRPKVSRGVPDHQITVSSYVLKHLTESYSNLLQDFKEYVLTCSPEKARRLLKEFQPLQEKGSRLRSRLESVESSSDEEEALVYSLKGFFTSLDEVVHHLAYIADRGEIDENSEDYKLFIAELIATGLNSPRAKKGNSLRELLD